MREREQVDTSANAKMDKEPSLPVRIPMNIVRWVCYSFVFFLLLLPFFAPDGKQCVSGGCILGWFASQLNALINKK